MIENNTSEELEENEPQEDELTLLKQRADQMGVTYHPAIGVIKLREKVNAALQPPPVDDDDEAAAAFDQEVKQAAAKHKLSNLSAADKQRMYHSRLRQEAQKLIRVRVTCMNPNKKNWPGEIFSVSNDIIGTVKKYVPFNSEEGYHVPAVLLTLLKERQYQHFAYVKQANGQKVAISKLLPEFAIETMTPLTSNELTELKQRQALNHSIE